LEAVDHVADKEHGYWSKNEQTGSFSLLYACSGIFSARRLPTEHGHDHIDREPLDILK